MKLRKRILSVVLGVALAFSLAACGKTEKEDTNTKEEVVEQQKDINDAKNKTSTYSGGYDCFGRSKKSGSGFGRCLLFK